MSTTTQSPPTLGRCPECGAVIASLDARLDESRRGLPALFAECPDCRRAVTPE